MSTFLGLLEEIPEICIDHFESKDPRLIFFLSHCHSDHTKGLGRPFFEKLKVHNSVLYCSHLSKLILENKFRAIGIKCLDVLRSIDTNSPKVLSSSLTVTCVPSGHCPGSVMFLFEKNARAILYTGDFRLNVQDLSKLKPLHDLDARIPRTFDRVYLDTTFLNKSFYSLPSRERSMREIHRLAKEWLEKDPRNFVSLECSANYGSEYLFIELSKRLNVKIHVKDIVYDDYARIVEIFPYITNDPTVRVHACKKKFVAPGFKCPRVDDEFVLIIVPSVMYWKNKNCEKVWERNEKGKNVVNVCYSTHSSCEELEAFVKYFRCRNVFACVDSPEIQKELEELLREGEGTKGSGGIPGDFTFHTPRPKKMRFDDDF